MRQISLSEVVSLRPDVAENAVFIITKRDKSTFIALPRFHPLPAGQKWWAIPTELCGRGIAQYHPSFVMAVLSIHTLPQSLSTSSLEHFSIPQVTFKTDPNTRGSIALNTMDMTVEHFTEGATDIFDMTERNLKLGQTDVIHDVIVYLMSMVLDRRKLFAEECQLRAESIAAYLGLSVEKVLLLLHSTMTGNSAKNGDTLTQLLRQGKAGDIKREIDLSALIENQFSLLQPYANAAEKQETVILGVIREILTRWQNHVDI